MTSEEAFKALGELIEGSKSDEEEDHYFKAADKILEDEMSRSSEEE